MESNELFESGNELSELCIAVKEFIDTEDYESCESLICSAMSKYPHAPQPHNLFGILLEKKGEHPMAMKHFRAAWALDPAYIPARKNLNSYGTFFSSGKCFYNESDCAMEESNGYEIEYDRHGIGRIIRKD